MGKVCHRQQTGCGVPRAGGVRGVRPAMAACSWTAGWTSQQPELQPAASSSDGKGSDQHGHSHAAASRLYWPLGTPSPLPCPDRHMTNGWQGCSPTRGRPGHSASSGRWVGEPPPQPAPARCGRQLLCTLPGSRRRRCRRVPGPCPAALCGRRSQVFFSFFQVCAPPCQSGIPLLPPTLTSSWSLFRTTHPHIDRWGVADQEDRQHYVAHSNATGGSHTDFAATGSGHMPLSQQRRFRWAAPGLVLSPVTHHLCARQLSVSVCWGGERVRWQRCAGVQQPAQACQRQRLQSTPGQMHCHAFPARIFPGLFPHIRTPPPHPPPTPPPAYGSTPNTACRYTFSTDGFTASTRLAKLLATGQVGGAARGLTAAHAHTSARLQLRAAAMGRLACDCLPPFLQRRRACLACLVHYVPRPSEPRSRFCPSAAVCPARLHPCRRSSSRTATSLVRPFLLNSARLLNRHAGAPAVPAPM